MPPCVIFEDEHLLVVDKPAGWNTHAPAPFAGEGIYDWLRHREPRWASLAIVHRLDKETSGVLVFGKTPFANKSLTEQFAARDIQKKYLLLTSRAPQKQEFTVKSSLVRTGEKYASSPHGEPAETKFVLAEKSILHSPSSTLAAFPKTGRTHQIRVHAAESGLPILGDILYGGASFPRVCLHAAEISFTHPATGERVTFSAPVDFAADPRAALRTAIVEPAQTDAFRIIHGASDNQPGWFVDKLGDYLLSQSERPLAAAQQQTLTAKNPAGIYHKTLSRLVGRSTPADTSPQPVSGNTAPEKFFVCENGVKFEMSFKEGYSTGLFLDQRDNRRRFLTRHIAADFPLEIHNSKSEILNCFAYSCGFSVCAALAGARTTSLDLSKKYLEWGKRNFALNGLDPAAHDFIFGDTFDWLRRLAKKARVFDAIVLDPPTFSRSKESGVWQAEKDYGRLVTAALPVLKPGGILLCSTNAAEFAPENFLEMIASATAGARRKITRQHYVPQPPDFPVSRAEPAYLKTVWLQLA